MITVAPESFRAAVPELEKIWPIHYDELAMFKDRMKIAWNYPHYFELEEKGELLFVTVRWNGDIAAYYLAHVGFASRYCTTRIAKMDLVYVLPDMRGHGIILPLLRCVERELKRRGVAVWYSGHKTINHLGMPDIYEKLGFQPADTFVAKWIGEAT